jgi:CheY-like chemotaxis protein
MDGRLLRGRVSGGRARAREFVMGSDKQVRVLLVEDNVVNARFAEGLLANVDDQVFHVQCADTLLAALDLMVHNVFDVALVDLSLPDSQGLETFLTIQRHAPELPIIVVTSLDDEAVALKAVAERRPGFPRQGKSDEGHAGPRPQLCHSAQPESSGTCNPRARQGRRRRPVGL